MTVLSPITMLSEILKLHDTICKQKLMNTMGNIRRSTILLELGEKIEFFYQGVIEGKTI